MLELSGLSRSILFESTINFFIFHKMSDNEHVSSILNDLIIIQILSHLSLKIKLTLSRVSSQFEKCVKHLIVTLTKIRISIELTSVNWKITEISKSYENNQLINVKPDHNIDSLELYFKRMRCVNTVYLVVSGHILSEELFTWLINAFSKSSNQTKFVIEIQDNDSNERNDDSFDSQFFTKLRQLFGFNLKGLRIERFITDESQQNLIASRICDLNSLESVGLRGVGNGTAIDLINSMSVTVRHLEMSRLDETICNIIVNHLINLISLKVMFPQKDDVCLENLMIKLKRLKTLFLGSLEMPELVSLLNLSNTIKSFVTTFRRAYVGNNFQLIPGQCFTLEKLSLDKLVAKVQCIHQLFDTFPNLKVLCLNRFKVLCDYELDDDDDSECGFCLSTLLSSCLNFCGRKTSIKLDINLVYIAYISHDVMHVSRYSQINTILLAILDFYLCTNHPFDAYFYGFQELWLNSLFETLCDKYWSQTISLVIDNELFDLNFINRLPNNLLLFDHRFDNELQIPFIKFNKTEGKIRLHLGGKDRNRKIFSLNLHGLKTYR